MNYSDRYERRVRSMSFAVLLVIMALIGMLIGATCYVLVMP